MVHNSSIITVKKVTGMATPKMMCSHYYNFDEEMIKKKKMR
jgi:hypothetical protein